VDLTGKTVVLYDGVCGLCNRLVQFLLRHDRYDRFRYAPLQSEFASSLLRKHGIDAGDLNSVSLVTDYGLPTERAFTRSDAVRRAARQLGGVWRLSGLDRVLPRALGDWLYGLVARNRYRMFGKYETCPMPRAEDREKFLDGFPF
jgi:predicted DCC family thiol-disulfide oxidoreductase YuxK